MKIQFQAYNPILKQQRTDKGLRVEFDVSQDQWNNLKELPNLPEGIYRITVEAEVEEINK